MTGPRPSKVLVVDDNVIIRRLQEAQLEALHVELIAASDGQEALELMRTVRPDLVLLDVVMPGLDGFRVCEALKGDPATRDVPVMVVTALGKDARDRSLAAGADDFMRKPPNTLLLRARALAQLRIRRAGLGPEAASPGPVVVASGDPELRVSVLAALPPEVKALPAASAEEARVLMAQGASAAVVDLSLAGALDLVRAWRSEGLHAPILLAHRPEDFTVLEEEHPAVDDFLELPAPAAECRHRLRLLLRLAAAEA